MRNAPLIGLLLLSLSACAHAPSGVCMQRNARGSCTWYVAPALASQAAREMRALEALPTSTPLPTPSATPHWPQPTVDGGFTCVRWDETGCTYRMSVMVLPR